MKKIPYILGGYLLFIVILRLPFWQPLDEAIATSIINMRTPLLTGFFDIFTHLGSTKLTIGLAAVVFGIFWYFKKRRTAFIYLSTLVGSAGTVFIIKNIVRRARPAISQLHTETSFSFPSGHSNAIMTVIGLTIIYLAPKMKTDWQKYCLYGVGALVVLLVGFSRLYLSVHWFTDVLAGFATAITSIFIFQILQMEMDNYEIEN